MCVMAAVPGANVATVNALHAARNNSGGNSRCSWYPFTPGPKALPGQAARRVVVRHKR
ncbi:hypothetical protein SBDP1_220027 [Syntrophobacter sp. SbD1]|nr:hypothetical protein SBDP1_220027 [Syntrophobacter sp. SbD1]